MSNSLRKFAGVVVAAAIMVSQLYGSAYAAVISTDSLEYSSTSDVGDKGTFSGTASAANNGGLNNTNAVASIKSGMFGKSTDDYALEISSKVLASGETAKYKDSYKYYNTTNTDNTASAAVVSFGFAYSGYMDRKLVFGYFLQTSGVIFEMEYNGKINVNDINISNLQFEADKWYDISIVYYDEVVNGNTYNHYFDFYVNGVLLQAKRQYTLIDKSTKFDGFAQFRFWQKCQDAEDTTATPARKMYIDSIEYQECDTKSDMAQAVTNTDADIQKHLASGFGKYFVESDAVTVAQLKNNWGQDMTIRNIDGTIATDTDAAIGKIMEFVMENGRKYYMTVTSSQVGILNNTCETLTGSGLTFTCNGGTEEVTSWTTASTSIGGMKNGNKYALAKSDPKIRTTPYMQIVPKNAGVYDNTSPIHVSYNTLVKDFNGTMAISVIDSAGKSVSPLQLRNDGGIYCRTDNSFTAFGNYRANRWYNIELSIYQVNKTIDIYINGEYKTTVPYGSEMAGDLGRLKIQRSYDGTNNGGEWAIDDINIYVGTHENSIVGVSCDDYELYDDGNGVMIETYIPERSIDVLGNLKIDGEYAAIYTDGRFTAVVADDETVPEGGVLVYKKENVYKYYTIFSEPEVVHNVSAVRTIVEDENIVKVSMDVYRDNQDTVIMIAEYKDGVFLGCASITEMVLLKNRDNNYKGNYNSGYTVETEISYVSNDAADEVKVFVWENLDNMKPLTNYVTATTVE